MARPLFILLFASLLAQGGSATAQQSDTVVSIPPAQNAPGLLFPQSDEPAAIPRNAALIRQLEQASGRQAARLRALVDDIERMRRARGEDVPPPPPPPPPPYIELATLRQQADHIANLRQEIIWQRKTIAALEKQRNKLRRR